MRKFALADQDADFSAELSQMRMRISVKSCRFGCGIHIIKQNFASFCINPYNCTDFNADFCKVMGIWMRISAKLFGSKQCEISHFFASEAAKDFRKSP